MDDTKHKSVNIKENNKYALIFFIDNEENASERRYKKRRDEEEIKGNRERKRKPR